MVIKGLLGFRPQNSPRDEILNDPFGSLGLQTTRARLVLIPFDFIGSFLVEIGQKGQIYPMKSKGFWDPSRLLQTPNEIKRILGHFLAPPGPQ